MIKAVIFDFGNVISKFNTLEYTYELEKLTGVPAEIFKSVYVTNRSEFDGGNITGAEMYAQILRQNGYDKIASDSLLMERCAKIDLESWRPVNDDVIEWGLSLQKSGLKLGILSNMPFEFLDMYEKEIPLFVAADCATFSCRHHITKPNPELYKKVLEGLEIKPEEAVFFDDIQHNIDAANSLGINGILWTSLEDAKRALSTIINL